MFTPIRTERLLIRAISADEGASIHERRNDPDVAKYQNWSLPFPRDKSDEMAASVAEMDGPENEGWWMAHVVDPETGEVFGDLAVHLSWERRTAEIGYTFSSQHWSKGYAVEAVEALNEYLFESVGVTRIFGMLHPDNPASAMVLERTGFLFEGHTRSSFWLGDEVSDDHIYGMLREDWQAWRTRIRTPPTEVRLVEVTEHNFSDVYSLETHKSQQSFVAPMPKSLAQALVPGTEKGQPVEAWYRAIEADGVIVGFVMVALIPGEDPFLWRLLIDRLHQRRGVASRALDLVEEEMRSLGAKALLTSWVPGRGSPESFYLARGHSPTGEVDHGEIVGRKAL